MTLPEKDVDSFIDALRSDLPSAEDEARVRARLLAAGVIVGAGLAAPSTAFGAAAGAKAGLLPKLVGLSWASKVGLGTAAVVVAASTVPVASHFASEAAPSSQRDVPAAVARGRDTQGERATRAARAAPVAAPAGDTALEIPASAGDTPARAGASFLKGANPAPASAEVPPRSRSGGLAEDHGRGSAASVGAFPTAESSELAAPLVDTTLRAETHLVERALAALKAGDRVSAAAYLREHARRFPNGHLARERERANGRMQDSTWH